MSKELIIFCLGLILGFALLWGIAVNTKLIDVEHVKRECVTVTVFNETKDFCEEKEL
jgi:hypothetical protein